jgi:hypothetical protein
MPAPECARRGPRKAFAVLLPQLILFNQSVGVVCQLVQGTDPRLPLMYFTVDSAILAGAVAVLTLAGRDGTWMWRLRLAAVVGVVISALVFAVLIAPATPTGTWFQPHDDVVVRVATVLMHGVAPVLVAVDYLVRPHRHTIGTTVAWCYPWPLLYVGGLGLLAIVSRQDMIPYPFLQPALVGWPTVAGALLALTAVVTLLGVALAVLDRAMGRRVTDDPKDDATRS